MFDYSLESLSAEADAQRAERLNNGEGCECCGDPIEDGERFCDTCETRSVTKTEIRELIHEEVRVAA